jgi:site-specific DNA-cytosine methylase
MQQIIQDVEIRHFHLFCGLGGGARGFNRGNARVGNMRASFRCLGGIDVDAACVRDFERLSGVRGTCLDLFDREQYRNFHGQEPSSSWKEATPADIRKAAGNERPHIVFLSAPCKGFSGLLSENRSREDKYQALNRLTLRGIWLMLEAWTDDPPELIVFENVPRIATRGRALLDRIGELLRAYGYAIAETTHDCGELGGLAQSRKRFLLVARHIEKVPPFLYEPPKRPLRAVGDVLGRMPLPGDPRGGPMHGIPNLQWKTWVRLAFVEAGSDWRSLNKLRVVDGKLADYLILPDRWYGDVLGVQKWDEHSRTITSRGGPTNGNFAIADPRFEGHEFSQYGVRGWNEATGVVTGQRSPGQGTFAVADPRPAREWHHNIFRIVRWDEARGTITSGDGPSNGSQAVADPRPPDRDLFRKYHVTPWNASTGTVIGGHRSEEGAYAVQDPRMPGSEFTSKKYKVTPWDETARCVISGSTTGDGAYAVADPRLEMQRQRGDNYLTAGHYGVIPWESPSGAVSAAAGHDNGRWSVADPRLEMPAANQKLICLIRALDNTWHRPFTTLELAALQSLVDPENLFDLDGDSDSAKRERIGNAVPPSAAEAIANVMAETLLLSWSGERFQLSAQPIWVQPIVVALSVRQP